LPPPPDSWASRAESDTAIWTIKLSPGARWVLPAAVASASAVASRRSLYFFKGATLRVAGRETGSGVRIELHGELEAVLINGPAESELLLLQGKPLGEPVAQYGPFVMNTQAEIQQAFADYRQTQFGGWPWPSDAPVHARERGRFARHADGRLEEKE
jgi:redox-sensitive bicupin YhaK (pirin superfamily)